MKELLRKSNSNIAFAHALNALEFPSSRRQKHTRFIIRRVAAV
jgi:hypothetical protein